MAQALQLVLADDHPKVRFLLKMILEREEFEIIGEAANGLEAVDICRTLQPDILVVDVCMPVMNGIEAARLISSSCHETKIVVLSALSSHDVVKRAFSAGARAYVIKDHAASALTRAIKAVQRGEIYLCPGIQPMRDANQDALRAASSGCQEHVRGEN